MSSLELALGSETLQPPAKALLPVDTAWAPREEALRIVKMRDAPLSVTHVGKYWLDVMRLVANQAHAQIQQWALVLDSMDCSQLLQGAAKELGCAVQSTTRYSTHALGTETSQARPGESGGVVSLWLRNMAGCGFVAST